MLFKHFSFFSLALTLCFFTSCNQEKAKTSMPLTKSKDTATTIKKREIITLQPTKTPDSTDTFLPIADFEKYLTGTPILGKDFAIRLDYPKGEKRHPLKNGQFLFRIKGNVESKTGEAPKDFKLRLFSNDLANFKANKAAIEWDIPFKYENGFYQFKVANIFDTSYGIFYYVIEDSASEEWYYVGKISLL